MSARRLPTYLILLGTLYLLAVGLFMLLEKLSLLDAVYFTVVTLMTIGYGDIRPLTPAGKLVVVLLMPLALVLASGLGAWLLQIRLEEVMKGAWRRMEQRLRNLSGHVIVCGYGRLGSVVVDNLVEQGEAVVVIDTDETKVRRLIDAGVPAVLGSALEEKVLRKAGLERARSVVSTFWDDTDNVYVVLSVRDQRSDIEVISAATTREAIRHLTLAGATKVISPTLVAGEMLARSARVTVSEDKPGGPKGSADPPT